MDSFRIIIILLQYPHHYYRHLLQFRRIQFKCTVKFALSSEDVPLLLFLDQTTT